MNIKDCINESALSLAIDASDKYVSIMIVENGAIKQFKKMIDKQFSVYLLEYLDSVVKSANKTIDQFDYFIAATGPGRLTSLRVGLSMLKAIAIDKPIIGISTIPLILSRLDKFSDITYYPVIRLSTKLFCTAGLKFDGGSLVYVEPEKIVNNSDIDRMVKDGCKFVTATDEKEDDIYGDSIKVSPYTDWKKAISVLGNLWQSFSDDTLVPNYIVKPRVIIKNDYKAV